MKRIFTIMILAVMVMFVSAQPIKYNRLKIQVNEEQLIEIAKTGIDITEGEYKPGKHLIIELSENETSGIDELGLSFEVLIEDVTKYYVERNAGKSLNIDDYKGLSEWEVPENFTFGSMSGHATYDEVVDHLDNMYNLFPELITQKESIGQSGEGRDLWLVKISDNPNITEGEPEVLYTSLHHAREPAGLMTNLFFMYYLLENYDSDPMIQALVDNTELYFLPVINPDGYVFNEQNNPSGGGMWRKNRTDNGVTGCEGVDLNRNYDFMWGLDNIGSSPDPCDATYRGESAFSELETQAIRDLCIAHNFVNIMNYHTYGNLLLYAWGYTDEPCEDDATFYAHSVLYTADNNYEYGAGSTTIYPTNGGSDDWMYGEQETKNKIFAYTPELGNGSDGFWCAIDRIVPIAQENMIMNILSAAFAGWYAEVEVESFPLVSETDGFLNYDITRLGLKDGGTFTVDINPLSNMIISGPEQKIYSGMEVLETITDSIPYMLNIGTPSGTQLQFEISVNHGDFILVDTITKVFGEAVVVFDDPCNDMVNWVSPFWDNISSTYVSPTASITDSPEGNYPNSHLSASIMDGEIDLMEAGFAMLTFEAKWEIETGYDYVQLMISNNGGTSWEALEGSHTVSGTSYQAQGEPVYDGFQLDWIQEQVDLSAYVGSVVTFRFLIKSDGSVTEDGFYYDDFRISTVEISPVGIENSIQINPGIMLSNPIPNPAFDHTIIHYSSQHSLDNASLNVYNSSGQRIVKHKLTQDKGQLQINTGDWETGIYYYCIESSKFQSRTEKLIVY